MSRFQSPYVCIVTGGSSGMGAGFVRTFAREGANVVFCAKGAEEGRPVESEVNAARADACLYVQCDITKPEQIQALIARTVEKYGRIDCLINNAGAHPPHKSIDEFSVDEFRALLDLNLIGAFAACKFALPHLRKTRGNIINISSLVAVIGQLYATTYVATKGALTAFTKALAIDEAEHGVRVNAISPGNVFTPMWQEALDAATNPAAMRAEGEAAQLLGRMGTIEEAAKLALFIAVEATFTTGVDHYLSAGAELSYARKSRIGITDIEAARLTDSNILKT